MRLTGLSFDEWIEHPFGHEVRFQQTAWFFDPDHDWRDPEPVEAVSYLTRLFAESERSLRWFSDGQIAQGLTYLVRTSASGDNGLLYSKDVPVDRRIRCVEAVTSLFAQLFAPRCFGRLEANAPLQVLGGSELLGLGQVRGPERALYEGLAEARHQRGRDPPPVMSDALSTNEVIGLRHRFHAPLCTTIV